MKNKPVIINNTIVTSWIYTGVLGPGCWEFSPSIAGYYGYEPGGLYPDGSILFRTE